MQPDGALSEPAWGRAQWRGGFVERTPRLGAEPPLKSKVAALYDSEALYVAVRMSVAPGEVPVAWELRRDRTNIWSDDAISLKLDPRLDERTSLVFVTNPAGTQLDFIALDNGEVFSVEHDAVWSVGTSVSEREWVAEYRVPFAALLTSEESARQGAIGINFSRDHNARQATYDWRLLSPEFGPFSALHYGRLEGLKGLKPTRPLTLTPYGVLRFDKRDAGLGLSLSEAGGALSAASAAQLGGELKVSLSPSEWLEATALTDFAQVDLDDPLINLNRFALYFPERRPFFINGLDVFSFGKPGRAQLFFSRRVGLGESGEVPLYGGLKLYGRRGAVRYGALSAMTGAEGGAPARLFNVARVRYDWGKGSSVGVMMVERSPLWGEEALSPLTQEVSQEKNQEGQHLGVGLDARARLLNARLELTGFYALTLNEHATEGGLGSSAGATASWRGLRVRPSLSIEWVEGRFDPVMGFVYRDDYAQSDASLAYVRYSPTPSLRYLNLSATLSQTLNAHLTQDLGQAGEVSAQACHLSNWCLVSALRGERDVVSRPFELAGVWVQPKAYPTWRGRVSLSAPSGRRFGGSASHTYQAGYFEGWLHNSTLSLSAALSPHLRLTSALNYARFEVVGTPNESISAPRSREQGTGLGANLQLIITPTPNVLLDAVTQLSSASEQLLTQARLRWRYAPGSDAFVVLRHAQATPDQLSALGLKGGGAPSEWRLTFKLAYRYDASL